MKKSEEIIKVYEKTQSIKRTGKICQCSWHKVVKVLSTNGFVINATHKKILDAYIDGLSVESIANNTGHNIRTVKAYIPAEKGIYGENRSANAIRIEKCRKNKRTGNTEMKQNTAYR